MNAQKVAYWVALAVFGLALHSAYQRGEFPSIHRVARSAQMQQLRWRMVSDVNGSHHIAVVCPKTGERIIVSDGSDLDLNLDLPTVEVSDNF